MRVISQSGLGYKDIAYDDSYIYIGDSTIFTLTNGVLLEMAQYSSFEKAERAMEMLHEAHVIHENYKRLSGELQLDLEKIVGAGKAFMYGGIFRFPQEDEIE